MYAQQSRRHFEAGEAISMQPAVRLKTALARYTPSPVPAKLNVNNSIKIL